MSTTRHPQHTTPYTRTPSGHSRPDPETPGDASGPPPAPRTGNNTVRIVNRGHRVLIGVVVSGTVIIAGIGFAGSYKAVRELAVQKGFGNFSYLFPIGIDAGICVLLALDLLLTWIQIPFPLLRQTAWLLTMATIAFNGAAAWPDPLGVGMHAVIPVLFVVSVEAARHAIGRMADITADKHMEGVRLTRWLLSPLPTFLLWRRMKLWELRSYDQVIKLEQERLVYQARLHARFGRAWRRKAPVESLMPLRLARYGIPLTQTTPSSHAAAGIDGPPLLDAAEPVSAPGQPDVSTPEVTPGQETETTELARTGAHPVPTPAAAPEHPREQESTGREDAERSAEAYRASVTQLPGEPTPTPWALWLRHEHGIATEAGGPLSGKQVKPLLQVPRERRTVPAEEIDPSDEPRVANPAADQRFDYFGNSRLAYGQEHGRYPDADTLAACVRAHDEISGLGGRPSTGEDLSAYTATSEQREPAGPDPSAEEPADGTEQQADEPEQAQEEPQAPPVDTGAHMAKNQRTPRVSAAIDGSPSHKDDATATAVALTTVDRYYVAWSEYRLRHDGEPMSSTQEAEQLSAHLADQGMYGARGENPVSPSNLRRYLLPFRIYRLWAEQRVHTNTPPLDAIAQECAAQGITAQHNKPITTTYIADHANDFERRWQTLTHHHTQAQAQAQAQAQQ
ncbi:DUF2637 domain-containing protein [Streptomyces geranii]|uniref:DUF2637 domain-containing protein n=1 Tax=Streptomyces geranii TaxID=2058923 RepID=UPI0038CD51AB